MGKWEMVRLGDVCESVSSNIAQKDLADNEGTYPIYGASGLIKYVDFYRQDKEYLAVVKDGAGIGRTMLLPALSSVIGTMQSLLPRNNVNTRYLYFAVSSMNLANYYTGSTIPHIYFKDYKKEKLPLPPLDVQQKIADVLDKASALIELRRTQLDKLDLLIKSQFIEMFGDLGINPHNWDEIRLVDACKDSDDIKCGPFGTQLSKDEYKTEGVPLWGIPQINSFFKKTVTDYLSQEKAKQLCAYSLCSGDIAMSRKGNVGMCALYPENMINGIIHSDVLRIRVNQEHLNPCFVMYQLHISPKIATQIKIVSSGAIMAGINVTKLKQIFIYTPPFELQNEFAAFVKQVENQKKLLQQSLSQLELNYKSLMQKCFRGEIF